jgi:hypothetical protein
MIGDAGGGWIGGVTAIVGLLAGLLGLFRYFNYRTRRDRIAAVGSAFETVVESLASDSEVKRLAAAIRLRRFFDPESEVGGSGTPYAGDALRVIAGILREQPVGNFQKLLADGLGHSPSLVRADLQRTNLQSAYLGGRNVSHADFYRADLSYASLKGAIACDAVFYQATLVSTVLTGADLRRANFFEADLNHAKFGGACLEGATFTGSRNIPSEIEDRLDETAVFVGAGPLQLRPTTGRERPRVFVSRPSTLTSAQEAIWRLVVDRLAIAGAEVVTVPRTKYPPVGILGDIRRAMTSCNGVVIVGFRQIEIAAGQWRPETPEVTPLNGAALPTPWNQVEAGVAAALGLPVLVVREPGVVGGIFDLPNDAVTIVTDLNNAVARDGTACTLERWAAEQLM